MTIIANEGEVWESLRVTIIASGGRGVVEFVSDNYC